MPNPPPSRVLALFVREPDPDCLDAAEWARWEALSHERGRLHFLLGRTALRHLAAPLLGVSPGEVPVALDPSGRPMLTGTPWHVSISHSGGISLAVLSDVPVGCDLEAPPQRERDLLGIARRFFAPSETLLLESLDPAEQSGPFLAMWTRKEAAYKTGLVDWETCLRHPFSDGDNFLHRSRLHLKVPEGVPTGWTARVATG
jgi:4'-phosphopantetheinyl transferase